MLSIPTILIILCIIILAIYKRPTFTKNEFIEKLELIEKNKNIMYNRENAIPLSATEMNQYYFGVPKTVQVCSRNVNKSDLVGPDYWVNDATDGFIGTKPL